MSQPVLNRRDLAEFIEQWADDPQGAADAFPFFESWPNIYCQGAVSACNSLEAAANARATAMVAVSADLSVFAPNNDPQAVAPALAELTAEHADLTPSQIAEHFFVSTVLEVYRAHVATIDDDIAALLKNGPA